MAFQCVIVTPEQQVMDQAVSQVILPGHDGLVGILTDRAPLLMKLGLGPLRVDGTDGKRQVFLIDGGIAQMKDNHLTILTSEATPTSELSAEEGRAEMAEATARRGTDEKSMDERQRSIQKGRLKQELAGK
jgi:F-type H+-transporting ATPase subunit epsilon